MLAYPQVFFTSLILIDELRIESISLHVVIRVCKMRRRGYSQTAINVLAKERETINGLKSFWIKQRVSDIVAGLSK